MRSDKGQALVLILLSMSVVLTIVLFILARSVTDVAVSTSQEDAVRAFSAAEAGIERSLVAGAGSTNVPVGDAQFTTTVAEASQGSKTFLYPISMNSGDSATLWFVEHDQNGDTVCDATHQCFTGTAFKVCWGKAGTANNAATTPAIEAMVFYESTPKDPTTIKIARATYDPNVTRRNSNKFAPPDVGTCVVDNVTYQFYKTISFSSLGIPSSAYNGQGGLQFARIRMFFNTNLGQEIAADVTVPGNSSLPSQGQDIVSTGTSGDSTRRVQLFQGWPEVPKVFEFAIYSSTSLTK